MKNTVYLQVITAVILISIISFSLTGCHSADEEKSNGIISFDTLCARVITNSNYVLLGDKYRAEVFMSAFSTTNPLELETDSSGNPNQSTSYNKGVCSYEIIPDSEGVYQFSGKIKMKIQGGKEIFSYPFKAEYLVARPAALIVPTEFVLYRGKENKINVSVPGIPVEKLSVLATNCKMTGEKGHYSITPGKENKVVITVLSYVSGDGKKIDEQEYPVVDK